MDEPHQLRVGNAVVTASRRGGVINPERSVVLYTARAHACRQGTTSRSHLTERDETGSGSSSRVTFAP